RARPRAPRTARGAARAERDGPRHCAPAAAAHRVRGRDRRGAEAARSSALQVSERLPLGANVRLSADAIYASSIVGLDAWAPTHFQLRTAGTLLRVESGQYGE